MSFHFLGIGVQFVNQTTISRVVASEQTEEKVVVAMTPFHLNLVDLGYFDDERDVKEAKVDSSPEAFAEHKSTPLVTYRGL